MQSSSKRLLLAVVVLAAALGGYFLLRVPAQTDAEQIQSQLNKAQDAAQRRDAAGVLQIVSGDYKDNNSLNNEQLALFLRRSLKRSRNVQVSISPPRTDVQGDTATSVSIVAVRSAGSGAALYNAPVTFHWKREDGTRLLVIPNKVWRIVGADYSGGPGEAAF